MTKKVMNVSFVLFTFFYKFNLSFFGNNIQNLSGIFSCPEFVWFICPEFIPNFSCSEFVLNSSGICPDLLSRICPEFLYWTNTGQILDEAKFRTLDLCQKNGQFPDILDNFRTFLVTISGHLFFIGLGWYKIFATLYYIMIKK